MALFMGSSKQWQPPLGSATLGPKFRERPAASALQVAALDWWTTEQERSASASSWQAPTQQDHKQDAGKLLLQMVRGEGHISTGNDSQEDQAWPDEAWEDWTDWEGSQVAPARPRPGRVISNPQEASGVSVREVSGETCVEIKHLNLVDAELEEKLTPALQRSIHKGIANLWPNAEWCYINVDLSENELGAGGVTALAKFLAAFRTSSEGWPRCYVRILKLYRNKLGDAGAQEVATLILAQPKPIHELHLSHNGISNLGAAAILISLGSKHPAAPYPFKGLRNGTYHACWVRLEHNDIVEPEQLVLALQATGEVFLSSSLRRLDGGWSARRSEVWSDVNQAPHAVLHIFTHQGGRDSGSSMNWKGKAPVGGRSVRDTGKAASSVVKDAQSLVDNLLRVKQDSSWHQASRSGLPQELLDKLDTGDLVHDAVDFPERLREDVQNVKHKLLQHLPQTLQEFSNRLEAERKWQPGLLHVAGTDEGDGLDEALGSKEPEESESAARSFEVPSEGREQLSWDEQLERALEVIQSLPETGDPEVLWRWQQHLRNSDDPLRAASRIMGCVQRLLLQGFCGRQAQAPPAAPAPASAPATPAVLAAPAAPAAPAGAPAPAQRSTFGVNLFKLAGLPESDLPKPSIRHLAGSGRGDSTDSLLVGLLDHLKRSDAETSPVLEPEREPLEPQSRTASEQDFLSKLSWAHKDFGEHGPTVRTTAAKPGLGFQ